MGHGNGNGNGETKLQLLPHGVVRSFESKVLTALGKNGLHADRLGVLDRHPGLMKDAALAFIAVAEQYVDLDAKPIQPDNMEIDSHQGEGPWKWNTDEILLYRSTRQLSEAVALSDLYDEVASKDPCGGNDLDYLMLRQHLIPKTWDEFERIIFLGTIYQRGGGIRCVRYIHRSPGAGPWWQNFMVFDAVVIPKFAFILRNEF